MKARYRKSGTKRVRFSKQTYQITPEWEQIDNINLYHWLTKHPDVFDCVCHFDYKLFLGIADYLRFENGLIFCSDRFVTRKLEKIPFVIKQAERGDGTRIYRIVNYSEQKLSDYQNFDTTVNTLIFRKLGGLGDVIMTFPVIEYAKKKNPNYKITYSCPTEFLCLAENNPYIDTLVPYSDNVTKKNWDVVIDLTRDCIKYEMKHQPNVSMNRSEVFMDSVGFNPKETPRPKLYLSEKELNDFSMINIWEFKKIAFILESNAPVRSWDKIYELRNRLLEDKNIIGYDVAKSKPKNYKVGKSNPWFNKSLRQVASLLNICDLVIGPDTGPMHMASALNVPTLWLFTHIDGSIRIKNYDPDITHFIQGMCDFK